MYKESIQLSDTRDDEENLERRHFWLKAIALIAGQIEILAKTEEDIQRQIQSKTQDAIKNYYETNPHIPILICRMVRI